MQETRRKERKKKQEGEETNKRLTPAGGGDQTHKEEAGPCSQRKQGVEGSSQETPQLEGEITAEGRPGQQKEGEEATTGQVTAPVDGTGEAGYEADEDSNP